MAQSLSGLCHFVYTLFCLKSKQSFREYKIPPDGLKEFLQV